MKAHSTKKTVSIAQLLLDNYEDYSALDGFDAAQVDLYIQNALTGEEATANAEQPYLVNATSIMLNVASAQKKLILRNTGVHATVQPTSTPPSPLSTISLLQRG